MSEREINKKLIEEIALKYARYHSSIEAATGMPVDYSLAAQFRKALREYAAQNAAGQAENISMPEGSVTASRTPAPAAPDRRVATGERRKGSYVPADGYVEYPTIVTERSGLGRRQAPQPSTCPVCNGNDLDAACAYPSERMEGCLRDSRLAGQGGSAEAELHAIRLRATAKHIRACSDYKNLLGDADYMDAAAARIEALVREKHNNAAAAEYHYRAMLAWKDRAESAEAKVEAHCKLLRALKMQSDRAESAEARLREGK